jgi:hypothetical protein
MPRSATVEPKICFSERSGWISEADLAVQTTTVPGWKTPASGCSSETSSSAIWVVRVESVFCEAVARKG